MPEFKKKESVGDNQKNKKRYYQEPSISNMDMTTTTADMNQTGFNNTQANGTLNKKGGQRDILDETDPDLNYAL